jgi:TusA-related sulfurtransferase
VLVIADDPMAFIDVPHMCRHEGFEVIAIARNGDTSKMTIRKP